MSPFGQYLGPERRGEGMTDEELAEAERLHRLRNFLGWFLLGAVTLLAVLSVVNTFIAADRAEDNIQANRLTGFTACVENANSLRAGLRNDKDRDIYNARHPDPVVIDSLNIPPAELERLIEKRVRQLKHTRDENFAPLNCLKIYPPMEGQSYPAQLLRQAERQLEDE